MNDHNIATVEEWVECATDSPWELGPGRLTLRRAWTGRQARQPVAPRHRMQVGDQLANVLLRLRQGGNANAQYIEPIRKILPEPLLGHGAFEVREGT